MPVVLHGGTLIQDSLTGEVIYEDVLPPSLLEALIHEIVREGQQPVLYRSPAAADELLAGPPERDSAATTDYLARQPRVRRLPYPELIQATHVISVGVLHYEDVLRPLYERLLEWPECKVLYWEPDPVLFPEAPNYLVDVVNVDCSKAKALEHLAGMYGIRMDEVMAIGDQINDIEMMDAVGLGIAMGNAVPAVRDRAQVVVGTHDEDGVAEALRRFVLDREPATRTYSVARLDGLDAGG